MKPIDDALQQELLEYIYELLEPENAARMTARIKSDPDVARAYAEVKQQASRLAEAARLHGPPVLLTKPDADKFSGKGKASQARGGASDDTCRAKHPGDTASMLKWVLALAAVGLLAFVGWQYVSPNSPIRQLAASEDTEQLAKKHLRLVVTGPDRFDPEISTALSVSTTTIDRQPLAADVKYAIYSPESGQPIYESEPISTDKQGRLTLSVPPQQLVEGARLEVQADYHGHQANMSTRVEVDKIRYATQLTTDRPLYRPGETIYFRSLTLTRFGLASDRELPVRFFLRDPSGGTAPGSESSGYTTHGVASGQYTIPPHLPGGTYTLVVSSQADEPDFPPQQRDVFIRRYRLPRLKKQLEFTRDSYAAGDTVVADFSAERAEGGAATDAQLTINATVDGEVVFTANETAGSAGTHRIEFTLPQEMENGLGTLSVVVDDGGSRETIAKTIPIKIGKVEVRFYPEGGDLIAGLENRVYFHAFDTLGEPVHIESGRIVDSKGAEVARLFTYHEGRGRFRFTPAVGETYRLEIINPAEATLDGSLPLVVEKPAVVMNTGEGVFEAGQPLQLDVLSSQANLPLVITAVCRGTQVAQQEFLTSEVRSIGAEKKKSRITLPLPAEASGVIRLTIYDYGVSPPRAIAERLVYRRPNHRLSVALDSPRDKYSPGDTVQLGLRVTDESGQPRSAVLGVSVVDDALLNLADAHTPTMPTFYFLTSEIKSPEDLEDANFYLSQERQNGKTPAKALDLLLGTQGWRRFVQAGTANFDMNASNQPSTEHQGVDALEDTTVAADEAGADAEAIENLVAMEGVTDFPTLHDNLETVQESYQSDVAALHESRQASIAWAGQVAFFGGLVLLAALGMMGFLRLVREAWFWLPATIGVVFCLVIGGLWMNAEIDAAGKVTLIRFTQHDRTLALNANEETFTEEAISPEIIDQLATVAEQPDQAIDPLDADVDAEAVQPEPAVLPLEEAEVAGGMLGEDINGIVAFDDERPAADAFAEFEEQIMPEEVPDPLGEVGEALRKELYRLKLSEEDQNSDWLGVGGEAGKLGYSWNGNYTGTVRDVATLRQQWLAANRSGNERAALALGKAYSELLKKYQLPVRQYAHQHQPGEPGIRTDFAETLYWQPMLLVDSDGRATINFDLSDSVTTFRVQADAHGTGRIGAGGGQIVSRIPFSLEPKLPLVVTAGDRIDVPLAVNNDTDQALPIVISLNQHGELLTPDEEPEQNLTLAAGERSRAYFPMTVSGDSGQANLTFTGLGGNLSDGIAKTIEVVPTGFPVSHSYSGQIDGEQEVTIELPEEWVEGSLAVRIAAFPSTLADLQKGMEGMLRDPNGCFEQTSSSNYPNVLALSYMEEQDVSDPDFTKRAKDLLAKGYAKLTSFECKEDQQLKGFEWFGQWPAHEALTAYGLMEFRDMSMVWDVDQKMIDRTAQWLMSRRDGKGGFLRNSRSLDSFGAAPDDVTNAYIVWALTEADQPGIDKELDHSIKVASESEDPYLLALAAASALNAGRDQQGRELLKDLAHHQAEDGHLVAKEATITRSGGISLKTETTALATLAWLKDPGSLAEANKAVQWLVESREGSGGFGNTQATILALKALIEHSKANRRTTTAGEMIVTRNGEEIGRQAFSAGQTDAIELEGLAAMVTPGENKLVVQLTGGNQMPYALDVSYRTRKPISDDSCPVQLSVSIKEQNATAGDTLPVSVKLENASNKGQPMTLAIVGLPAGLEARVEHLEELHESGAFDFYEVQGREVVFYWRSLSPEIKGDGAIAFDFDVIAEIPGSYTGPASRAYLYYTDELKHWVEPLSIKIDR